MPRPAHSLAWVLLAVLALVACGQAGGAAPTPAAGPSPTLNVSAPTQVAVVPSPAIATNVVSPPPAAPTTVPTPAPRDTPPDALISQAPSLPASPAPALLTATPADLVPLAPTPASAMQRRDAPPEGVASQLGVLGGAAGSCIPTYPPPLEPQVGVEPAQFENQVEVGLRSPICLDGFPDHTTVQYTVTMPDGQIRRSVDGGPNFIVVGPGNLHWMSLPGDPPGLHGITATDDELTASAEFSVAPASYPRAFILTPNVPVGGEVQAVLSGFPPQTTARLSLYVLEQNPSCSALEGSLPSCYVYMTELSALTDASGGGYLALPADVPGSYLIESVPTGPRRLYNEFQVE